MGKQAKIRSWRKKHGFLPKARPDADGMHRVPIPAEHLDMLRERRAAFIAKFGREPGPTDPVIFDPSKDEPTPLELNAAREQQLVTVMLQAGVDPMLVYASWKTGRIVTKENSKYLDDEALEEWTAACEQWKAIESGELEPDPSVPAALRPGALA